MDVVVNRFVAVGTNGADSSGDGESWIPRSRFNLNAISFAREDAGWGVGPEGTIIRYTILHTGLTSQ
jgi:hypothetical protein